MTSKEWDLIIRPERSWWDLRLGELWRYRDLVWLLVWRDFVSQYKLPQVLFLKKAYNCREGSSSFPLYFRRSKDAI